MAPLPPRVEEAARVEGGRGKDDALPRLQRVTSGRHARAARREVEAPRVVGVVVDAAAPSI